MNIDIMDKEELLEYKKLLEELKKEKILRNINITYTSLSFISFIVLSNIEKYEYSALSALITILGLNFISSKTKDITMTENKIKTYKKTIKR